MVYYTTTLISDDAQKLNQCSQCSMKLNYFFISSDQQQRQIEVENSQKFNLQVRYQLLCCYCFYLNSGIPWQTENQELKDQLKKKDNDIINLSIKLKQEANKREEFQHHKNVSLDSDKIKSFLQIMEDYKQQFTQVTNIQIPMLELVISHEFNNKFLPQCTNVAVSCIFKEVITEVKDKLQTEIQNCEKQSQNFSTFQQDFTKQYQKLLDDGTIDKDVFKKFLIENQRNKKFDDKCELLERIKLIETQIFQHKD